MNGEQRGVRWLSVTLAAAWLSTSNWFIIASKSVRIRKRSAADPGKFVSYAQRTRAIFAFPILRSFSGEYSSYAWPPYCLFTKYDRPRDALFRKIVFSMK